MKTVQAPWFAPRKKGEKIIFIGGGISGCLNWQEKLIYHLANKHFDKKTILANPRRDDFDITNPNATLVQIKWEHCWLEKSDVILFWFPKETLCPITLFELGSYIGNKKKTLIVGCDPEYKRLTDVIVQTRLRRPEQQVHIGFEKFMNAVSKYVSKLEKENP